MTSIPFSADLYRRSLPWRAVIRFTLLDAWRNRWWTALLALVGVCSFIALFCRQLALTEASAVATTAFAPAMRLGAVMMIVVFVATAVCREFSERTAHIALGAPLGRSTWLTGKWLGFCVLAGAMAMVCGLPLVVVAPSPTPLALAGWVLSLALELSLMASVALMFAMALRQAPASILAAMAFYVASRLMSVMLLLNERSPLETIRWLQSIGGDVLKGIGAVLPRLDLFTRTDWLLEAAGPLDIGQVLLQSGLYIALALVIAAIDFGNNDV